VDPSPELRYGSYVRRTNGGPPSSMNSGAGERLSPFSYHFLKSVHVIMFLSRRKTTSNEDRDERSHIVEETLTKYKQLDRKICEIVELVEMAENLIQIDFFTVVNRTDSPEFAMYLMKKELLAAMMNVASKLSRMTMRHALFDFTNLLLD
jgi:hypothetical protein